MGVLVCHAYVWVCVCACVIVHMSALVSIYKCMSMCVRAFVLKYSACMCYEVASLRGEGMIFHVVTS